MSIEVYTWLYDINQAIEEIDSFFTDTSKTFLAFQQDLKTRRAIERNLEIIGEALKRILEKEPNIGISNSRKIVDTRNRIIHGYDSISEEIIWSIVIKYLPILKEEVTRILENNQQ
jgi:uncharacterized protein with HEPN domain